MRVSYERNQKSEAMDPSIVAIHRRPLLIDNSSNDTRSPPLPLYPARVSYPVSSFATTENLQQETIHNEWVGFRVDQIDLPLRPHQFEVQYSLERWCDSVLTSCEKKKSIHQAYQVSIIRNKVNTRLFILVHICIHDGYFIMLFFYQIARITNP